MDLLATILATTITAVIGGSLTYRLLRRSWTAATSGTLTGALVAAFASGYQLQVEPFFVLSGSLVGLVMALAIMSALTGAARKVTTEKALLDFSEFRTAGSQLSKDICTVKVHVGRHGTFKFRSYRKVSLEWSCNLGELECTAELHANIFGQVWLDRIWLQGRDYYIRNLLS
jgi:hypothetical protein